MNLNSQKINEQDLEQPLNYNNPFIKTNLSFKDYLAYPDKIIFEIRTDKSGDIKISKSLKNFTKFDYLYVKIENKYEKLRINKRKDRKYDVFIVKTESKHKYKSFKVYLKTTPQFNKVLKKAFESKQNILDSNYNGDFRITVNEDGKLLLKFLVPSLVRGKEFFSIHNLLSNKVKSLTFNNFKNVLTSLKINPQLITPFSKNYFVVKSKEEIKFISAKLKSKGKLYRAIGIINGDGHLGHGMIICYGNDDIVHKDFREGLENFQQPLKFQNKINKFCNVNLTQVNSTMLVRKLSKIGAIVGNKLRSMERICIPQDFYTYTEYIGGMFDTEGAFITDSHLILPASISIKSKESSLLNEKESQSLIKFAEEKGRHCKIEISKSEYYTLGMKLMKEAGNRKHILKKILNPPPPISSLNKKILDALGIESKLELKSIYVYPKSENINTNWWVKITLIKDVIKFFSLIDTHSIKKKEKIKNFIFRYINKRDYQEIKDFIKKNLRDYNGSSNKRIIDK